MTDDEINVAIAQACGWWGNRKGNCMRPPNCTDMYCEIPNYCSDLNAMHEAEKVLLKDGGDSDLYMDYLMEVVVAAPAGLSNHATARQRAKAFLRTLGLWKEVAE